MPQLQKTQSIAVQGQQKFIHHSSKRKIVDRAKLSDARYIPIACTQSQCLISDLVFKGPVECFFVYKHGGGVSGRNKKGTFFPTQKFYSYFLLYKQLQNTNEMYKHPKSNVKCALISNPMCNFYGRNEFYQSHTCV